MLEAAIVRPVSICCVAFVRAGGQFHPPTGSFMARPPTHAPGQKRLSAKVCFPLPAACGQRPLVFGPD
jgi:hypothetical protein